MHVKDMHQVQQVQADPHLPNSQHVSMLHSVFPIPMHQNRGLEGACIDNCDTNGRRIAIQMGGVLQYKWEEYWQHSLSSERRGTKVLQYKLEAYCDTNWRCIAILF